MVFSDREKKSIRTAERELPHRARPTVATMWWSSESRASMLGHANDAMPTWIRHDLTQAGALPTVWEDFARKARQVHGAESGESAIETIVKAATKASFNKKVKSKSVVPFLRAYVEGGKIDVECLGRAKSVAAAAAALGVRVAVMANETHVFVQQESGEILDFETNIKYRDALRRTKERTPYYYAMVVQLDDRGIIATTMLNDGTDDASILNTLDELYPHPHDIASAPVWVRVFRYENSEPKRILQDNEALSHPFVALDFAKRLHDPSLLQKALTNLSCGLFEYSKEFFYENDGDTTFLESLEHMLKDETIEPDMARSLLSASQDRADECLSKNEAISFRRRCDALEEKYSLTQGKRRRKGGT